MKCQKWLFAAFTVACVLMMSGCGLLDSKPSPFAYQDNWVERDQYVYKGRHFSAVEGDLQIQVDPSLNPVEKVLALGGFEGYGDYLKRTASTVKSPSASALDIPVSAISVPTGFSTGGSIGMSVLRSLAAGCDRCGIHYSMISVAYVPKSESASAQAAYDYYLRGLADYYKSLAEAGVIGPIVRMGYGESGDWEVETSGLLKTIDGTKQAKGEPIRHNTDEFFDTAKMQIVDAVAPAEIGGYPCYAIISRGNRAGLIGFKNDQLYVSPRADIEIMRRRAEMTPIWMAWYFPARHVTSVVDGEVVVSSVPTAIFNGQFGMWEPSSGSE